jgi:hypothetical protein
MNHFVCSNVQLITARKKSPVWHCLVKRQVIFCIATTAAIVLTPHRLIAAVEAFVSSDDPFSSVRLDAGEPQQDSAIDGIYATETQVQPQDENKNRQQGDASPLATPQAAKPKEASTQQAKTQDKVVIPKKRQEELLAFVKEHQPQLEKLLRLLRKNRSDEYQSAVEDLDRDERRISSFKDKDPQRYQIELNLWITKSQISLLVAQLSVKDSPELQKQLRQNVARFFQLRQQQLISDKQRLQERLSRVEENIERIKNERPELIERQFQSYLRNAQRQRKQSEGDNKTDRGNSKKNELNEEKAGSNRTGGKSARKDKSTDEKNSDKKLDKTSSEN